MLKEESDEHVFTKPDYQEVWLELLTSSNLDDIPFEHLKKNYA
jgi:hypothetical protein